MIKVNTSQSIKNLQMTEIAVAVLAAVVAAIKEKVAIFENQQANLVS